MKKNLYATFRVRNKHVLKVLIMSKCILLLILVSAFQTFSKGFGQDKITLNLENVSLRKAFKEIEKKTQYRFLFNDALLPKNENKITLNVENTTIDKVMPELLSESKLTYKLSSNLVIIARSEDVTAQLTITGTVADTKGVALPGVIVRIKGSEGNGTTTDINGRYSLSVPDGSGILVFSYLGFVSQEVSIDGKTTINVILAESKTDLKEVVVVAFGTQKKSSMVSAITTINPKDLKVPSSNLTTALAGRLSGVISYQRSGEPGQDNASFFIRGVTTFGYTSAPLILVDGIETSTTELARMQPDDVGSFSIMKDATSTALYGARGANGVILVTTKSGVEGPAKVNVRFENSISSNTQNIKLADPVTYMQLANEAVLTRNRIGTLPYQQNKIDNTIAGLSPYVYPAHNWMDELIQDQTINQRLNFSASGGSKIARYYIAGTANQDNGNLKVDERNNFNSNINLKSYQLRSNINLNMTKTTEVIARLSGSFDDYNGPIDGGHRMYQKIMLSNPVLFPSYYPSSLMPATNHILFGNADAGVYVNPYADMVKGYRDGSKSLMYAQFELKQDLAFVLPGLSARGMFNTSRYSYFDVSRNYNPFFYNSAGYNNQTDVYGISLLNENAATEYLNYNEGEKDINTTTYIEAAVNYSKTFAKKNDITGLLVYQRREQLFANQKTLQKSLPYRNQGVAGRFTYGYDNRYLAELNFGYNGSERFYKTERYGFFPAVGLGWYVSNEKFWNPVKSIVSKLKFKGTYGLVGNDAIGSSNDRFFYLSEVNLNDGGKGAVFGSDYGYFKNGITVNRYDNRDITWEIGRKFNVGVELGIFNDLEIQADYFSEQRENILMDRSSLPSTMGLSASVRANVGKALSNGFDMSASYKKNFNQSLWLQGFGNFTYAHSEILAYDEPAYKEQYKSRIGNSLSQYYGLVADRLFVDDMEVANSPRQNFGEYFAGDIKYRDVNGDGKITDLDQVPLGFPTVPEITYGFGFSTGYKGFDFSAFCQGQARNSFWIDSRATAPYLPTNDRDYRGGLSSQALLQAYADDHWSEDNRNVYALWPRLSYSENSNNAQRSTWFMRNGAFLRLKSVEFGYTLPTKMLSKWHVANARFYLSGTNLATISGFKLWDIEMGGNGLGYPVQKVFNGGIQIGF